MAALSLSNVVETEHALSAPLGSAEAIYRANLDMLKLHQEVLRVVLLDCKYHCIMKRDTFKGTVSECLAHLREFSVRQSSIQHSLSRSCTTNVELHICCVMWRADLCAVSRGNT